MLSDSLDSYYQELGRAGRDGEPARAILFSHPDDLNLQRFFAGAGKLAVEEIEQVTSTLRSLASHNRMTAHELCKILELSNAKVTSALPRLEDAGAVETLPDDTLQVNSRMRRRDLRVAIAEEAAESQTNQRKFARSRIEIIGNYATTHAYHREFLLSYFGEAFQIPCGACDNCCRETGVTEQKKPSALTHQKIATEEKAVSLRPFEVGARATPYAWCRVVTALRERQDYRTLGESGYATLSLDLVVKNGLLMEAEQG